MAGIRTRGMSSRTTAARAADIAALLYHESCILLKLYKNKEKLPADVADGRLVSVSPTFPQLDTRGKLWHLYSALEQCHSLLKRAIAKEEEALDGEEKGEYENKRRTLKDRLSHLLGATRELLEAAAGPTILTPGLVGSESDDPTTLFELKLWMHQILTEVKRWSETAVAVLQELQSDATKEPPRRSARNTRSVRR